MTALDDIAGRAKASTLYGIGVGPGDARYMTLRAAGLVGSVDVLAFFAKKGRPGNARRIITPLFRKGCTELRLEYPVTTELPTTHPDYAKQIRAFYEASAKSITGHLDEGCSVGLLSEGDPFFYGSFMHLFTRLPRASVEVVPAVTGMSAAWTATGQPVTWGDDVMTVLMGTLDQSTLAKHMGDADALVVMKIGRNLAKIRAALRDAGKEDAAWLVEYAAMPKQTVRRLAEVPADYAAPYFSIVIVHGQGRRP